MSHDPNTIRLEGDQVCVCATDTHENGQRVYVVWTLVDQDDEEQAFQSRLLADSAGQAVDAFVAMLAEHRLKSFQWKGPARTKLRRVK